MNQFPFLVSHRRPGAMAVTSDAVLLEDGIAVMPAFPVGDSNHFIAADGSGFSYHAKVGNADPEVVLEQLKQQYPGLPARLLSDLVVRVAVEAACLPEGEVYTVFVTPESAKLCSVTTNSLVTLWSNLDTTKYMEG